MIRTVIRRVRNHIAMFAVGATAATVLIAGGATFVGAQSSNDTIEACVIKNDQSFHLARKGKCGPGETLLTWSVNGPQGSSGPTGASGPAGSTGPAGTPAAKSIAVFVQSDGALYLGGNTAATTSRVSQGLYSLAFPAGTFNITTVPIPVCTVVNSGFTGICQVDSESAPQDGSLTLEIAISDSSGNLLDSEFTLLIVQGS